MNKEIMYMDYKLKNNKIKRVWYRVYMNGLLKDIKEPIKTEIIKSKILEV